MENYPAAVQPLDHFHSKVQQSACGVCTHYRQVCKIPLTATAISLTAAAEKGSKEFNAHAQLFHTYYGVYRRNIPGWAADLTGEKSAKLRYLCAFLYRSGGTDVVSSAEFLNNNHSDAEIQRKFNEIAKANGNFLGDIRLIPTNTTPGK